MKLGPSLSDFSSNAADEHVRVRRDAGTTVYPFQPTLVSSVAICRDRELIRATLVRQKDQRERVFSQDLPFSWLRLLVGLVSISFVLTDVPRSGIGINDLSKHFSVLEPDSVMVTDMPWDYPVFRASIEEAHMIMGRVWSYKYDTTSVVWRAVAEYLNVSAYPPCLHYRGHCSSPQISGTQLFEIINSLVDAVANKTADFLPKGLECRLYNPRSMVLRTESEFNDRVHDYLLPGILRNIIWRTNQVIYLPMESLINNNGATGNKMCARRPRPFFCHETWINFRRSCQSDLPSCRKVGTIYTHTNQRLLDVQRRFPNSSVDLTILESYEDLQVSRLSFSIEGNRRADISTIIRARNCKDDAYGVEPVCRTVYIEDYRYEVDIIATDVVQWYHVEVVLRLVGQTYFFVRVMALSASCYFVFGPRMPRGGETVRKRVRKVIHLISKVPTQCIVFGSPVPIFCYTLAHLIDASVMYLILEKRFISQNGIFDISFQEFISVAIIQMRSVWVYAILMHAAVKFFTAHRSSSWSHGVIDGVVGVPEFFLTGMASINIIAQFRSTHLRSTRLLGIWPMTNLGSESARVALSILVFGHKGRGNNHFGGVVIDLKFLVCILVSVGAYSICRSASRLILQCERGKSKHCHVEVLSWPLGRTPVPYSAEILWPAVSLCVHWTSDFFCVRETTSALIHRRLGKSFRTTPLPDSNTTGRIFEGNYTLLQGTRRPTIRRLAAPSIRMDGRVFSIIQRQLESLHDRNSEVEGNIAFMNLVLMSDPITYFQLRFGYNSRITLAYYQSLEQPTRVLLLPESAVTVSNEPMCRLRRMRRVHIQDMRWSELVQCG